MKQAAADDARARGQSPIKPAILKPLLRDYDRCLAEGLKIHPEVAKSVFTGQPVDFAPE